MRQDGRSSTSLRELDIVLDNLDRVDGSASFAFGDDTKALASVSGPIQVRLAAELPSRAAFEVTVRPLSGITGVESKSVAATLRTLLTPSLVLTQNPRTLIQLVVQSLTPSSSFTRNPSLTAAFINASTLALLRTSSFPMLGVVCAASVGRVKEIEWKESQEKLILDVTEDEVRQCDAFGCVAVMFGSGPEGITTAEVVWSSFQGAPLQADYDSLLRLGKIGAQAVYNAIRERFQQELDRTGLTGGEPVKKMPKFKGARVGQNASTEDTAMDTT
ncbi:hypothetical protein M422DRAFT_264478 [Sphaerobolus stellatus SS14]|uniref:Unplaced genomic scaffold SPHSTscaffold_136, whole genome shotgun sequence n=1 Tax=Sphaerobolus stellatus (strain SS14) TaxID=990650 RepID=A0A0C9V8B7_SPHS4|nr:hypothetical protein M422DRAFT_264478 [Sphaerobolus stellatus SS14]